MDYAMTEDDIRSEEDDDERLEELYNDGKAEFKADSESHHFDGLFSLESAMQKKTVWGFKATKRLLKSAIEQSNLEAISARYRQLMSYENVVTSNDFDGCVIKVVNVLTSLSKTGILDALFSISMADEILTNVSARTAIKLAQPLVRLQPSERTLGCLADLQRRLQRSSEVSTMTKHRYLLELYVLEMELLWRTRRFENMDVVYGKALSMEDAVLASQRISSAHGFHGRYLLRCDRPVEALEYLVKAVKDETSIVDEHHTACVQSLALVAYTSADTSAHELLHRHSGRRDVAAIRRFAMAFLREEVDGLELVLEENDGTFDDVEIWRLLRHYETVLKRKLCMKTSPLPGDCWSDVLQFLTHPVWHELQSLCRKFDPVLASFLHHLHSDVRKALFERVTRLDWKTTLHSKSGREDKVVFMHCDLDDALLASAVMRDVVVVEIKAASAVTDEGIVRFCFGGDARQLVIREPLITHGLFARLVEEHLAAANDHEFTLTVTYASNAGNAVRRQITTASFQHLVEKGSSRSYEIPSRVALLTVKFAISVSDLDTMTVTRKRLNV
ncbi:PCI domain-containing protein [Aphelenchoides avenae]|nr:PCI domain-containing protein [Aphelenchus avenae]